MFWSPLKHIVKGIRTMTKSINLVIGIGLLVALVAYAVFLYVMYHRQEWIFSPYEAPPLPNGFQPNGRVTKLTPDEEAARRRQILGTQG